MTHTNANGKRPLILPDILGQIGNTPLVRINKIAKKLDCELLAKCEFFNAGGSIKDRIALNMVIEAEASGRLKPGDTLIEPTSGNTGIGLALAAAVKGYRCLIVLPEKMSQEKVDVLKALGAEIIRTPTEAAWDSPESHIGVAKRLNEEIPNSHILDQYTNPANPGAHYHFTAEELLEQCDGKIDMLVAGAGTGGTISGVAKKLKEKCPDIQIIAVDPVGSILAQPESLNDHKRLESYQVEGIGYDFIPDVLNRDIITRWEKVGDEEAFVMARRMIREEGLLCGGSCGSAMVGALRAAATLKTGQRCVVILPDSTRNYMTKFLNDQWMYDHEYVETPVHSSLNYKRYRKSMDSWWASEPLSKLELKAPTSVLPDVTCDHAIAIMESNGFDQLPVVDAHENILGVISIGNLWSNVKSGKLTVAAPVSSAVYPKVKILSRDARLAEVAEVFDVEHFVLVTDAQNKICGLVTRMDLLRYMTSEGRGSAVKT